jgi:hypothetical protein
MCCEPKFGQFKNERFIVSNQLSEVTTLIAERASELEKAREVFSDEIGRFVEGILRDLRLVRKDPWVNSRVRVDVPRDIESAKGSGFLTSHYAIGRPNLRFKKGTTFQSIADVRFGVEFDDITSRYAWVVSLIPSGRFPRLDDGVWYHWRTSMGDSLPPGSMHQEKANTVRFMLRALDAELTRETAYADVKSVLEFLLSADAILASTIGVEFNPGEESPVV